MLSLSLENRKETLVSITRGSGCLGVVSSIVVRDGESPSHGEGLDGNT